MISVLGLPTDRQIPASWIRPRMRIIRISIRIAVLKTETMAISAAARP